MWDSCSDFSNLAMSCMRRLTCSRSSSFSASIWLSAAIFCSSRSSMASFISSSFDSRVFCSSAVSRFCTSVSLAVSLSSQCLSLSARLSSFSFVRMATLSSICCCKRRRASTLPLFSSCTSPSLSSSNFPTDTSILVFISSSSCFFSSFNRRIISRDFSSWSLPACSNLSTFSNKCSFSSLVAWIPSLAAASSASLSSRALCICCFAAAISRTLLVSSSSTALRASFNCDLNFSKTSLCASFAELMTESRSSSLCCRSSCSDIICLILSLLFLIVSLHLPKRISRRFTWRINIKERSLQ
ncbi:hypothetical protein NP493_782g00008 [Ridgeia piscesae]|uniref:Uncharacterized protein n=1 Tax=Ridgeia piscesae TaxID=27915 RepID=A0AAD9KNA6_RIDPI|nr:hypothetical protein NP493_782g00008 [Ridgeia piscesae]